MMHYKTGIKASVAGFAGVVNLARLSSVTVLASAWKGDASPYSQVVGVPGANANTMVNLQLNDSQLEQLRGIELAMYAENKDGVVTVVASGDKPTVDLTMQASLKDVKKGDATTIIGNTVATTQKAGAVTPEGGDGGNVPVTEADNGKFMRVVDGAWAAVSVPNAEGGGF